MRLAVPEFFTLDASSTTRNIEMRTFDQLNNADPLIAQQQLMALMQAAYQGKTRLLLKNSALVAVNLVHVNELGLEHAKQTGQSCRSIDRPLPYAVPVLLAVTFLIVAGMAG